MRVFWSSVIVDNMSDRMYVHTIHLSGCMDRHSRYRVGTGGGVDASGGNHKLALEASRPLFRPG